MPQEDVLVTGAHPSAGWMAVVEVPGGTHQIVPPRNVGIFGSDPGIAIKAAIVVEKAETLPQQLEEKFMEGDVVYIEASKGIPIGDRLFVAMSSVIAYKKENE